MPPPLSPSELPAGQITSILLTLVALTALTIFMSTRAMRITNWGKLPLVCWLVFAIYADSYMFVFATAVLQHSLGINSNVHTCGSAILLCLSCYVTTKLVYLFLVEKAHIVRNTATKSRLQSKLYVFNSFGMLSIYISIVIINFVYRIVRMDGGQCIIGMKRAAMIPLISFDAVVNVYLTLMFLIPLKRLYSFKNMARTKANMRLRTIALRTFIGAACTLLSSIVNLSFLLALKGEPGWVCLICCNADILFSAFVVQWITSKDNAGTQSPRSPDTSNLGPKSSNDSPDRCGAFSRGPGAISPSPPDIALTPTRCSTQLRIHDASTDDDTDPGAVVVTTTIRRESNPDTHVTLEDSLRECHSTLGYRTSRRLSGNGTLVPPDGLVTSHTIITGGRHSCHLRA